MRHLAGPTNQIPCSIPRGLEAVKYEFWRLGRLSGLAKYEFWRLGRLSGSAKYEIWSLGRLSGFVKYEFWRLSGIGN